MQISIYEIIGQLLIVTYNILSNYQIYVADCEWNVWETYSACSVTCGEGTKTKSRTKSVEESGGGMCSGEYEKTISCYEGQCTSPGNP